MAGLAHSDEDDARRLAEASAWRVALTEAGLETDAEFAAWLAEDDLNAAAWERVQAPWTHFGAHATAPEMMAARRDALEHARRGGRRRFAPSSRLRGARAAVAASVAILAALSAVGGLYWAATRPEVYRTVLGERRTVTLADGSRVALDSGTMIKVRLRREARKLDLIRGQARFDVAHDVTRPFSVHARDQTVVATGTSFNIDLLGPRVLVTLIEGRVSVVKDQTGDLPFVDGPSAKPSQVRLEPGQQLVSLEASSAPPRVETVSLDKSTAWEGGQLVFDNEPLSAVAERISRYTTRPVVVSDPSAASLKISGVFNSGDVETFIDTVTRYLPVVAVAGKDGSVELRSRG
jgi:transmembrane sensor